MKSFRCGTNRCWFTMACGTNHSCVGMAIDNFTIARWESILILMFLVLYCSILMSRTTLWFLRLSARGTKPSMFFCFSGTLTYQMQIKWVALLWIFFRNSIVCLLDGSHPRECQLTQGWIYMYISQYMSDTCCWLVQSAAYCFTAARILPALSTFCEMRCVCCMMTSR